MNSRKEKIETRRQNNFLYLFAGLLILIVAAPTISELHTGHETLIFQLSLDATLILGIWSVVHQRRWFILGLVLSLVGISITIIDANLNLPELKLAGFAVVMPFYTLTAVLALRYIFLKAEEVGMNSLAGAICVYMLIGIIWAILYSFVDFLIPGSFSGMTVESAVNRGLEFYYYSFVTLTTLGYGDLLPVSPIARALGYFESLIGLIYLAVLIAGLVSIHISRREPVRGADVTNHDPNIDQDVPSRSTDRGSIIEYVREYNFMFLFASLMIILLIAPVMIELKMGRRYLLQVALDVSLLLGIWSIVAQRRWFVVGVILLICGVCVTITDSFLNLPELKQIGVAIVLPFYLLTAVLALKHVLAATVVDANNLMGSLCVYLLMGLIWAIVYSFIEFMAPGSFSGLIREMPEERLLEFIYYSFVTLTTLGYGDILPVNPIARSFANLQVIIGQCYVAVLIAGLLGVYISDHQNR